jgi:hypothetical protein
MRMRMVKMRMRMVKEMVFENFMSLFNFEYYQCVFQTRFCCISNEKLWIGMGIMFNVYIHRKPSCCGSGQGPLRM